jgi:ABC-type phosphate transport system substrate-binding protein
MTKRTTTIAAGLSIALIMFLGPNVFAANPVSVNLTGSSAMFNLSALAGFSTSGCGTNIWTKKSTSTAPIGGVDQRAGGAPIQTGNIWVIWNSSKTTVCSYLTVDSAVGNEMFFAVPKFTLSIDSSWVGQAGSNLIPTLTDVSLDATVYSLLNNQPFNGAATDIRPEDALFEVNRCLAPLDTAHYTGLGYGPGPVGTPIQSAFSTSSATPVAFAVSGNDPISGGPIPAWTTTSVGAEPVMVFVNSTVTGAGHFGSSQFNNIDRWALADVLNGTITRTRDITNVAGLPSVGIPVMLREPTSGTYTTMEFNVPRNAEINSTQELGVDPSQPDGNPLNITYASGGSRRRVIGTGQMVSEVSSNADAFGYAFWSTGNFANALSTTKYLSVDGVDALNYSWYQSQGTFPNCVYPCRGLIPFVNVLNGSYPIWSILRVATNLPTPSGIAGLIRIVQSTASKGFPDIVPFSSMQMFRSHYDRPGQANPTSNGHVGEPAEAGGDVGGAVFPISADTDFFSDTGLQLVQLKN